MLEKIILQIISAFLGIWLANKYIPEITFSGPIFIFPTKISDLDVFFKSLIFVSIVLGLINSLVKPFIKKITFPIRIITFNLFNLVIAMALVKLTDILFLELEIKNLAGLFYLTILILAIFFILSRWLPELKHQRK